MAFCSNCGAAVDGRFCAKCGAPVNAARQPDTEFPRSAPPAAATGMPDNLAGALCYALLIVTGVLFLLLEPYSKNRAVRFHAFQAILLNVAWFVAWFALNLVTVAIHVFGMVLGGIFTVAFFGLWIYMMVTTYQGKTVVLPVIGQLAQQQA